MTDRPIEYGHWSGRLVMRIPIVKCRLHGPYDFRNDPSSEGRALIPSGLSAWCGAAPGLGGGRNARVIDGTGVVAMVRLADGRSAVVKEHRWNAPLARMEAVQRVQARLADAGFPAPRPLCPPAPFGFNVATAEELRAGGRASARSAPVRRSMAATLHRLAKLAGEPDDAVGQPLMLRAAGEPLWWTPHDARFDFEATADGAEWIDGTAASARAVLEALARSLPFVVGHCDWRVENLGFAGADVNAVYDWDSLLCAPEAVFAGAAAATYTADWRVDEEPLPSPAEMRLFMSDYQAARGRAFDHVERAVSAAALLYTSAYTARCFKAGGGDPAWLRPVVDEWQSDLALKGA